MANKKFYKMLFIKLFRYNITNIATFLIDALLIVILTELIGVYYLISIAIGLCVATLINYVVGRRWIFIGTKQKKFTGYFIALSISLFIFLFVMVSVWYLVTFLNWHYLVARLVVAIFAGIIGYILDAKFTFKMSLI